MHTAQQPVKRRVTRQRKLILETLRSTKSHPTADWIYQQVRNKMPDISLGTVYRNLRLLKEIGEIQELNFGSSYSRFDGTADDHYHFTCTSCGNMMDVELDLQDCLLDQVEKQHGWQVTGHRLEFSGLCQACREKGQEVKS